MNKSLFFVVFAVVFILGCTSASGPAGPGLTIREFTFSPASLTGAQKTSLTLVVQNTGSMDVKDAYAKIFGFGEKSKLWNVATACEGCGTGDKNTEAKIPLLRAQSSFAGNVGEQKKFVWLLQNIDTIPKDMARSYTANARLCYPYSTTALGRVELMSENEWMSKNSPQHEIIVSQTSAPVRITVLSKQPIISSGRLSLDLLIENTGGGVVTAPGYCRYNFGGDNILFRDVGNIKDSEWRDFIATYFNIDWKKTPTITNNPPIATDGTNTISFKYTGDKATATQKGEKESVVKTYEFSIKDGMVYDDPASAASRLNRLNLEISGLTKEKCTTSVGASSSIFLEKGKSVKVSADCGIGSESAPISAADLKIEMGYDYYVDAKANVMVKGTKETGTATTPNVGGGTETVTPASLPISGEITACANNALINHNDGDEFTCTPALDSCTTKNSFSQEINFVDNKNNPIGVSITGSRSSISALPTYKIKYGGQEYDFPINKKNNIFKQTCSGTKTDIFYTITVTGTPPNIKMEYKYN